MKIVLAGGTGFVGKALFLRLVREGHYVVLLTRNPKKFEGAANTNFEVEAWDGKTIETWRHHVDGADAVINLAGEGIADRRWSKERKRQLVDSRVQSTQAVVAAIAEANQKPGVLINASAIGYYGDVPEGDVTESHDRGTGFLAEICEQWEQEALKVGGLSVRIVLLRIGVVLERGGGAMEKMIPPFQFFMGGPLGSGKQWFPWVHREDIIGSILFALQNQNLNGPVNCTALESATMAEFSKALGRVMGRPSWAPVPGFMLKLLLGEMSEMLLGGQKVVPEKLSQAGYAFQYPQLEPALRAILKK